MNRLSRRQTWRILFLISPSLFWLIVFFLAAHLQFHPGSG